MPVSLFPSTSLERIHLNIRRRRSGNDRNKEWDVIICSCFKLSGVEETRQCLLLQSCIASCLLILAKVRYYCHSSVYLSNFVEFLYLKYVKTHAAAAQLRANHPRLPGRPGGGAHGPPGAVQRHVNGAVAPAGFIGVVHQNHFDMVCEGNEEKTKEINKQARQ